MFGKTQSAHEPTITSQTVAGRVADGESGSSLWYVRITAKYLFEFETKLESKKGTLRAGINRFGIENESILTRKV